MSAPRRLSINPDVGLKIEIVPKFEGIDHTDSSSTWTYRITNLDEIFAARHIPAILESKANEGLVSPTSRVTLSRTIRRIAGIPEEATTYAFMYPPIGLAEIFQSVQTDNNIDCSYQLFADSFSFNTVTRPDAAIEKEEAIKAAILLGGFVYFDDDFNCIRINALSRTAQPQKLNFSGPFTIHIPAYEELHRMGRTQHLRVSNFREAGFESFAWVRPRERLCFKPIFKGYHNPSGSLLFFREDRTAVGYAVDSSGYLDPKGNVDIICDALSHIGEANFTQYTLQPLFEIKPWKKKVEKNVDTAKLTEELKDKRTLLHKACHAALGTDFITNLLANLNEASNLSYQDSYGWTPLHYACRFSPRNRSLIMLLVNACPDAVLQSDHYNRCPLHIACDSNTSKEVITILLGADTSLTNHTLLRKTKRFWFLPIHLACYGGASHSVIKTLLDADRDGVTLIAKTKCEQLPLHLAIIKQLHPSTVRMIIDGVSKVDDDFYHEGYDAGVYEFFEAKLPLHLACWNNSSSEIIEMLLDKDREHVTTELGAEPDDDGTRGGKIRHFSIDDKPYNWVSKTFTKSATRETVALHLAMKHGSPKVIRLLLQKELDVESYNVASSSIYKTDNRGRRPLHIACECISDPKIIQLLIELDTLKQTLQLDDLKGFRPLHYVCARNKDNTSTEILKILCDTESRAMERSQVLKTKLKMQTKIKIKTKKRSTHTAGKEQNRTPLCLAIKTGMPTVGIDILMEPGNFTLDGIDDTTMTDFAEIVKDCKMAKIKVNDVLASRGIFSMMLLELYANIIALAGISVGTLQLKQGTITQFCPILLICSSAMFMTREMLQIISIHYRYATDIWNWIEVVTVVSLLNTALFMLDNIGNPKPELQKFALCLNGFLIVVQVISFLRSTFLPFARFFGGLVLIVRKLIPFLIVSVLLMCAFLYGFYVTSHQHCETFMKCIQINFQTAFNYGPGTDANFLDILFGIVIVIVLLNVVVAIVGEAWDDAATQSEMFFWRYRLDKIFQYQGLGRVSSVIPDLNSLDTGFLHFIDNLENISIQNDIAWSQEPYNNVTTKAHYDNPQDFFDAKLTRKVKEAKSLYADLLFGNSHSKSENDGDGLSFCDKFGIILWWLGKCLFYLLVLISGIATCGVLLPKNFRSGILSYGLFLRDGEDEIVEVENEFVAQEDNIEETNPIHEIEEYVAHKRSNLREAGVPENDIDIAIPATLTRTEVGAFDYFYKQHYNSNRRR